MSPRPDRPPAGFAAAAAATGPSRRAGGPKRPPSRRRRKPDPVRTWVRRLERTRPGLVSFVLDGLAGAYGHPVWERRLDPTSELILTILTQNTADVNAEHAFESLRRGLPGRRARPASSGERGLGRGRDARPGSARLARGRERTAGRARRGNPPGRSRSAEGAADPGRPAHDPRGPAATTRSSSSARWRRSRPATGSPGSTGSAGRRRPSCSCSVSAHRSCRSIATSSESAGGSG